ncbi:inositol monophosphatase family protein [Streptomyces nojiriensis]
MDTVLPAEGAAWVVDAVDGAVQYLQGPAAWCVSITLVEDGEPVEAGRPEAAELAGRSLSAVLPAVGAVRNLGPTSWQIADVAAGRLDAFWEYGRDDSNLLPGALLAREAGAEVTDPAGAYWRAGATGFVAAPAALHGHLLALLPRPVRTGS